MEKFIVSARKYRPQTFSSVVGQAHITTTLKNSIRNNTLAHAFLFCGPRGVGKTTCARILAKTINCENLQPDGEACNKCSSCVSFNNGTSLNIHELDAASNNSVDDIRELVTQIRFAPQEGKYKIYIIDEVHMLSASAFNAFLKTLEEPPSYAKFILATTEKHKILPTILSRCQIFDFKRITNADTVEHLQEIASKESIDAEKAALQLIAQKSEGCMRDSLSILDKIVSFTNGHLSYQNTLEHLNLLDEDYFFKLLQALTAQDVTAALLLFDEINRKGFEGNTLLEGFAEFLRNLMVSKDPKAAALLEVLEGMQERYAETARQISLSYLVSALQVVSESAMQFRDVHNKRLHVELCLIKLCYLQQAIEMMTDSNGQVVKKSKISGPVAIKTRSVAPVLNKMPELKSAAKLIIDSPTTQGVVLVQEPATPILKHEPLKKVEQPTVQQPTTLPQIPVTSSKGNGTKVSLIDKLRQDKLAQKGQVENMAERMPVLEEVLELWNQLNDHAKNAQKHSTSTSIAIAQLRVEGLLIIITCASLINQKFIEQEATLFTEWLRLRFNNPKVQLKFEVLENQNDAGGEELAPKYLNAGERLKLMAASYPLVMELKERLKLDLGY